MAAIFRLVANIMANKGAEPAPLRRVQTVVKRPRCVGDFTQVVGVRTQGIGLHAHLVDGRPILIALDLVVLGLAFLRIGTLRFSRRGRSLLPQLEHPIGTALRHVVQCGLNGAPILALIRRQPKIRLEASDSRVGNVENSDLRFVCTSRLDRVDRARGRWKAGLRRASLGRSQSTHFA